MLPLYLRQFQWQVQLRKQPWLSYSKHKNKKLFRLMQTRWQLRQRPRCNLRWLGFQSQLPMELVL